MPFDVLLTSAPLTSLGQLVSFCRLRVPPLIYSEGWVWQLASLQVAAVFAINGYAHDFIYTSGGGISRLRVEWRILPIWSGPFVGRLDWANELYYTPYTFARPTVGVQSLWLRSLAEWFSGAYTELLAQIDATGADEVSYHFRGVHVSPDVEPDGNPVYDVTGTRPYPLGLQVAIPLSIVSGLAAAPLYIADFVDADEVLFQLKFWAAGDLEAQAFANDLAGLSDARWIALSRVSSLWLDLVGAGGQPEYPYFRQPPAAASDVQRKARVVYVTAGDGGRLDVEIPSVNSSLVSKGDRVSQQDPLDAGTRAKLLTHAGVPASMLRRVKFRLDVRR